MLILWMYFFIFSFIPLESNLYQIGYDRIGHIIPRGWKFLSPSRIIRLRQHRSYKLCRPKGLGKKIPILQRLNLIEERLSKRRPPSCGVADDSAYQPPSGIIAVVNFGGIFIFLEVMQPYST